LGLSDVFPQTVNGKIDIASAKKIFKENYNLTYLTTQYTKGRYYDTRYIYFLDEIPENSTLEKDLSELSFIRRVVIFRDRKSLQIEFN
jgi:hypothetical protein